MTDLITLVPLFPLLGFLFLGLFGKSIQKTSFSSEKFLGWTGSLAVLASFIVTLLIYFSVLDQPAAERTSIVHLFTWLDVGSFTADIAYQVDQLSLLFTMIITGVGFLIHLYSIGYMHGDEGFYRFFAYLNLFIFMMLNLVLADNFLLTFLGWEGVGLASYLLIGFWYKQKFPGVNLTWTGDAARKAFIANRVGDFGMLVGMFILFTQFGTLSYSGVAEGAAAAGSTTMLTIGTLLIFLGCTGKSAQIPLFVWLPDAMAGPTSVSALIHAATMVTSGIFLVARNNVIFSLSQDTMMVIAIIGMATALFAATMGLVQKDIKKVLAYSTVSQLGFMFAALGVGGFTAAVFHVMTHAFFKACLFLGSGSVIHGMHGEQDITKMGGLKKHMPHTYWTFLIASVAIAGIPGFAGFFSKDEILLDVFINHEYVLWGMGIVAAFCTAFYMFRLVYLTFHGEERFDVDKVHPHESPATMTFPLWVLAILSICAGYIGLPHVLGPNFLKEWLAPIFANANVVPHVPSESTEWTLMLVSTLVAVAGILLARSLYKKKSDTPDKLANSMSGIYNMLWNKYWVDEVYYALIMNPLYALSNSFLFKVFDVKIIDGMVNGMARMVGNSSAVLRRVQSGVIQNYALVMMIGIVGVIMWMLFV